MLNYAGANTASYAMSALQRALAARFSVALSWCLIGSFLLAGLGSTASYAGLFTDDEAQKKIGELQVQAQAMDARLSKLENLVQSQGMVDLLTQLEALKGDVAKLRGQIEIQSHDIESAQKRQKDFYVDLDTRLRRLESTAPAASLPVPAPSPATGTPGAQKSSATPPQSTLSADPAAETRAYEAALSLFKVGNYQGAIAGFQTFLKTYPASNLASSSQYWIGNSHFALHDFKSSLAAQQKLISQYPNSQKVPDAMLNIASSYQEMGDTAAARKALEDLVAKYPISPAAELAQKRLGSLK